MPLRRVVITGVGAVSPFGAGAEKMMAALTRGESGIGRLPQHDYSDTQDVPQVAGRVPRLDTTSIPRRHRRTMSPMSCWSLLAAEEALAQAAFPRERLSDPRFGVIVGSTMGSIDTWRSIFENYLVARQFAAVKARDFFRIMGHSVASNLAQALDITGRVMAVTSACASSAQSIGMAYEAIACGLQDAMLCGGADEFHPLTIATFDHMAAASRGFNDHPHATPRPFDQQRDGVVCAEGAGILLLESRSRALARGATILAEITGFASASDVSSIANPDPLPLRHCMQQALNNAQIPVDALSYINAHATGTRLGDIAESEAIAGLCGKLVPVSSLKGHLGHTMAASGALELIACIGMLQQGMLIPTLNLDNPDEQCDIIRHVNGLTTTPVQHVLKNSFALGGIISTLILRKI